MHNRPLPNVSDTTLVGIIKGTVPHLPFAPLRVDPINPDQAATLIIGPMGLGIEAGLAADLATHGMGLITIRCPVIYPEDFGPVGEPALQHNPTTVLLFDEAQALSPALFDDLAAVLRARYAGWQACKAAGGSTTDLLSWHTVLSFGDNARAIYDALGYHHPDVLVLLNAMATPQG